MGIMIMRLKELGGNIYRLPEYKIFNYFHIKRHVKIFLKIIQSMILCMVILKAVRQSI